MSDSFHNVTPFPVVSDEAFDAHMAAWSDMPGWLADLKREAWARFKSLPMPKRRDEAWRFAKTDDLVLDAFSYARDPVLQYVPQRPIVSCGGCLDFADDVYVGGSPVDEGLLKKGVLFLPLEKAVAEHPALVREHLFERLPDLGSEKFQALHAALFSTGVFLYVPRGVEVSAPLAAMHEALREGGSVFPHTLVVAEEGARVTMFDVFRSGKPSTKHFACAVADVFAGRGATVGHRVLQSWSDKALAFHLNSATATQEASVSAITVNLGGGHVRGDQHGRIVGRGGSVEMHSLSIAAGEQEIDQRTLQTHSAEDGHSDLLYKNVLLDKARTIFSGLIRVDPDAQRTDAYQTNRNLLLSPEAEANSMPGLEILANDVKCSHGSSTGQLDPDQLFYFLARGVPKRKAQEMMVFGFFEEVLAKFDNEELAEYMRSLLKARFGDDAV